MKKNYFLLVAIMVTILSFGQTTVFQETFETGNSFTASEDCTDNGGDFFTVSDGTNMGSYYQVTGMEGTKYFAAMDIDGAPCTLNPQTLEITGINIATYTNLTFAILVAEDDSSDGNEDWDDADSVIIEVNVDGAGYQTIMQFEATELRPDNSPSTSNKEPKLDTDFDGTGDGSALTSVFQEFTASIASGNTADIRITFSGLNSGDEDIALDNVRIIDNYSVSPTIALTSPVLGTVFAPGTTSVDVEFTTANTNAGDEVNVTVNGTTSTNVTSPFTVTTVDGMAYTILVELVNGGVIDDATTNFSVGTSTIVADIAALRADVIANGDGGFYEITGASKVTHTDGFRNRHWIEDTNIAGILIDDLPNTMATYVVGDMVTGLKGKVTTSNGTLQLEPTEDSGIVASQGNAVIPQTVTIVAFNASPVDYEAELIKLEGLTFTDGDGTAVFATGQNYDVSNGTETTIMRTTFYGADYIGGIIPTTVTNLTGVAGAYNGTAQIYVRDLTDMAVAGIENNAIKGFTMYPNPVNNGILTITTLNNLDKDIQIFNILGKQVLEATITGTTVNIANLNAGIYLIRVEEAGNFTTRKLVIR